MSADLGYWLIKSEPDVYSIDDLARDRVTGWEGVRNYQARNYLRDTLKLGDLLLYYHSRSKPMAVVGLARVAREGYPDPEQFDPESHYYDPKATPQEPRWVTIDVEHVASFERIVTLDTLKTDPALAGMLVTQRGQRLSVQPVEPSHFERVLELAGYQGAR